MILKKRGNECRLAHENAAAIVTACSRRFNCQF